MLIGLDGMRADSMLAASTPSMDALASNGAYSWMAQTELRTVSGPAWTALLTGAHAEVHGVDGNEQMAEKRKVPTIVSLLKKWNGSTRIIARSHWKPIITDCPRSSTKPTPSGYISTTW